ncbi:hypothetical protein MTR67_008116 [Solanum verrucosum]|uniref:UBA domain-containing protein n=1 Tax=Solanum verrucosum TaxID=315347 RepID=A0AAF0Q130_SOLVR|nr:hypothetical protein MTR67_008116 [Solanum verrucosum]
MDKHLSEEDSDNIDWDTEDELEIQDTTFSSCRDLRTNGQYAISGDGEASSSSVPGQSTFIQKFLVMGFSEESIAKAIEQNGENSDLVLDALLTLKVRNVFLFICKLLILDFVACLQAVHFLDFVTKEQSLDESGFLVTPIRTHEEIVPCEHWILGVDCAINNASCSLPGFHSSGSKVVLC